MVFASSPRLWSRVVVKGLLGVVTPPYGVVTTVEAGSDPFYQVRFSLEMRSTLSAIDRMMIRLSLASDMTMTEK